MASVVHQENVGSELLALICHLLDCSAWQGLFIFQCLLKLLQATKYQSIVGSNTVENFSTEQKAGGKEL